MSRITNEIRFRAILDTDGAIKDFEVFRETIEDQKEAMERPIQLYIETDAGMVEAELYDLREKAGQPIKAPVEVEIDPKTQAAIEEMQEKLKGKLRYQIVVDPTSGEKTAQQFKATTEEMRKAIEKPIQLYTVGPNNKEIEAELLDFRQKVEEPMKMEFDTEAAIAGIRDLTIIVQGAISAINKLTSAANELLDSALTQRRAMTITKLAFGDAAGEIAQYAASLQDVTNYADHQLLPLMSKMAMAYKLSKDEVMQLTPHILDLAEAHKATGMTVERAFDLMGRALTGHTEFLGRVGIQLDKTRLAAEGVSYLVEKLGEDYGGTAEALADLRLQNAVAWTEIKESIGEMLNTIINPLLKGLKFLMDAYNDLSPVMKGFVAGITVAIPVIVTTTSVIAALTAAVHALKVAINPVAAVIGIAVGALSALAFGLAAAKTQTDDATKAQKSLKDEVKEAERQVATAAERFRILSSRLLELRSATNRTAADKREMRNIIRSLNRDYGEYLGNINLETASYDQLAAAITAASEALVSKKIAEVYGERYNAQIRKVAEMQIQLNEERQRLEKLLPEMRGALNDYIRWTQTDENPMGGMTEKGIQQAGAQIDAIHKKEIERFNKLQEELKTAKEELQEFAGVYRQAMLEAPDLTYDPAPKGGGGGRTRTGTDSELERRRREAMRLMEELERLRLTETERIQQEYDRRLALIQEFTEAESETQKTAIENLNAWKAQENKSAEEKLLKAEISYYETLESLGVDSYNNLREAMREYYAWAHIHLTEKEQQLIKAQIEQMKERRRKLEEERQKEEEERRVEELERLQELADIRHDFHVRDLELSDKFYQAELAALEKYYEERRDKQIEAGLTEEEIERQKYMAIRELRMAHDQRSLSNISSFLGNMADLQNTENEKGFKRWQALSIVQGYVDTFTAAISAYKAMVGIPLVGPGLAAAAAAAAVAAGMGNIARIKEMKYEPQQYATGGLIRGRSHQEGGVLIEAEGDEYITAKDRVKALGKNLFDFLNFAPLGQVKLALAGLPVPSVPVRQVASIQYGSGGSVSSGLSLGDMSRMLGTVKDELVKLRQAVTESRPIIEVNVDPLDSDPVRISEINDQGKMIRSEI